jgi:hypothetical protein
MLFEKISAWLRNTRIITKVNLTALKQSTDIKKDQNKNKITKKLKIDLPTYGKLSISFEHHNLLTHGNSNNHALMSWRHSITIYNYT